MNSRVEARFRDVDDARGKLVSLTGGAGFRLLVKQALAPGEPLQIDIGDGNLLVVSRYCFPVELGHSFGAEGNAEGIRNWRPAETAIPLAVASPQNTSGLAGPSQPEQDRGLLRDAAAPSSAWDRRRRVLGGIAAVIVVSALGIRGDHANAVVSAFAKQTPRVGRIETAKKTAESPEATTGEPQPAGRAGSNAILLPDKTIGREASMPASKAQPVPPITRVNVSLPAPVAAPRDIDKGVAVSVAPSTMPARRSTATVTPGPVHSVSIKASSTSWVTACADGVAVFRKAFNAGESAEIPFAHRASVHSGNAGAIELTIGNQSMGPMGKWGEVRTVRTTPAGHEFLATTPASNCSDTIPEN